MLTINLDEGTPPAIDFEEQSGDFTIDLTESE